MDKKEQLIKQISISYYSRKDIQKAISKFCQSRESVPRYYEGFGKRPDTIENPSDVLNLAKKGATSFHTSEEIWRDPFQISTSMEREQLDELRDGWDLLIDIDSKFFDYSRIMAKLLIEKIGEYGIENIGVKFSGSKGFHIILPWQAFPESIAGIPVSNLFPELPRKISLFLHNEVKDKLTREITNLTYAGKYVKDNIEAEKVAPDLVLVSSRHLFRTPYSLHEKTRLASVVIDKDEVENFTLKDANPLNIKIKDFYPTPKKDEAKQLVMQALDWHSQYEKEQENYKSRSTSTVKRKYEEIDIDKSSINYPPCIKKILNGMKDGRKRGLFVLLNYLLYLKFTHEEVKQKIEEWNKKNEKPLKQGYVNSQITWSFNHKKIMPPNCDKSYYKETGICDPDNLCKKIKNPLNYTIIKSKKLPKDKK